MQRALKSGQQFVAVKLGARAVMLDDLREPQFDGFIGCKTFVARRTAPSAAYSVAFFTHARIDNVGVFRITEWTFHKRWPRVRVSVFNRMEAAAGDLSVHREFFA